MTKAGILLEAGKRLAATAAGRAFKGEPIKTRAEDVLSDPAGEKQGEAGAKGARPAEEDAAPNPGNPNALDHSDQDPGREKS